MKFKGILSLILVLCMLLSAQSISVFADSTEETTEAVNVVTLFAAFNNFDGKEMTSEDNQNFYFNTNLDAGSYQFTVDENGSMLSHPTTVKDSTAFISAKGIELSEKVDAKCTLLSTGGEYTFEYNTQSNRLKVTKKGVSNPSDNGESLTVKAGPQEITAKVGDKFTYNVYLKADKAFEDIQAVLNFDESKLNLKSTTAETCCPALKEASFNTVLDNLVAVNSSNLEGYDFKEEKLIFTFEFTATSAGKVYIDFIVQDMTIKGGESSYYFLSKEVTEGADFREELVIDTPIVPTTATEPTNPADPTGTTSSTDPEETEVNTNTTNPDTLPTESVPASSADPSESGTDATATEPFESSSTTEPSTGFELGDVNRDSKLNIRDATLIQKALAKLEVLDNEQLQLADYLTDGKVNIKDATQIQKKLANLI